METIGQRIKRLREEKEMTQIQLAEEIGLKTKGAIQKIEAGTTKDVKQTHIIKIAQALGVSTRYIAFGSDDVYKSEFEDYLESAFDEDAKQMFIDYMCLDDKYRKKVNEYVSEQFILCTRSDR